MEVKVKVVNRSKFDLPKYSTLHSSGLDLRASIDENILLKPLERKLIPTGLYLEIPVGVEAQVRPRSGMALKKGITVLNTPGTIDSDYRGEVGIILINLSNEQVVVEPGERIAQIVFAEYKKVTLEQVEMISDSERGAGGFGHTGVK